MAPAGLSPDPNGPSEIVTRRCSPLPWPLPLAFFSHPATVRPSQPPHPCPPAAQARAKRNKRRFNQQDDLSSLDPSKPPSKLSAASGAWHRLRAGLDCLAQAALVTAPLPFTPPPPSAGSSLSDTLVTRYPEMPAVASSPDKAVSWTPTPRRCP